MNSKSSLPSPSLKCCSYNMHGFYNGISMLHSLCESHDIVCVQEHWLHNYEFSKFSDWCPEFNVYGISAMNDKVASGILVGRPFGGVAVLWKKNKNFVVKFLQSDDNGRYLVMSLKYNTLTFIIHCIYCPCNSGSVEYLVEVNNLFAKIELNLGLFTNAFHIISGDFNIGDHSVGQGAELLNNLVDKCKIVNCDSFNSSEINYTYNHTGLNHRSWIDHFFVSNNFRSSVDKLEIIDNGLNTSDHLPISCTFRIKEICSLKSVNDRNNNKKIYRDRWDKANLSMYYNLTGELLQSSDKLLTASSLLDDDSINTLQSQSYKKKL